MQLNLISHPSTPPADPPFRLWANVEHAGSLGAVATCNIWFGVGAPAERFAVPMPAEPARADDLWKTTCFEMFLRAEGETSYREWNFAPSGAWAAYDFADYRKGKTNPEVRAPYVRVEDNMTWWALGATIALEARVDWQCGLSAVIEESDGTKSYWALAHPDPEKPDFHAADCFTASLA